MFSLQKWFGEQVVRRRRSSVGVRSPPADLMPRLYRRILSTKGRDVFVTRIQQSFSGALKSAEIKTAMEELSNEGLGMYDPLKRTFHKCQPENLKNNPNLDKHGVSMIQFQSGYYQTAPHMVRSDIARNTAQTAAGAGVANRNDSPENSVAYRNDPPGSAVTYRNDPPGSAVTYRNDPPGSAVTYRNDPSGNNRSYLNSPLGSSAAYRNDPPSSGLTYKNTQTDIGFVCKHEPDVGF